MHHRWAGTARRRASCGSESSRGRAASCGSAVSRSTSASGGAHASGDAGGEVRLVVYGELDLCTAARVQQRLLQVGRSTSLVRVDLVGVSFVDSHGLHTLIETIEHIRAGGCAVSVEHDLARQARRLVAITGTGPRLWPVLPPA